MKWPPPALPRNFPLSVTTWGYVAWIAGKTRWICGKKTPAEALTIYHRKAAALTAGSKPLPEPKPEAPDAATLGYVLRRWLLSRRADADTGTLGPGSYAEYKRSGKRLDALAGHLRCADVTPDTVRELFRRLVKRHGTEMARRHIAHLRAACRDAAENGWCRAVNLGRTDKLAKRPKPVMRWRLYTPAELALILKACRAKIESAKGPKHREQWQQMLAMLFLALNGGYGAKELADLPKSVIDLDGKRIDFARGKTGAAHSVPLWDESIAALRPVLAQRPGDTLLFRTRQGNPWAYTRAVRKNGKIVRKLTSDHVAEKFRELVTPLGLKVPGQGFYKLKALHSTTADAAGDIHATFTLRGHQLPGVASHYVRISEERVREVVAYIRQHLLGRSE